MRERVLRSVLALVLVVALAGVLFGALAFYGQQAQADAVSSWFLTTVVSGGTSYTGTQYFGEVYAANYGRIQVQVTSDTALTTSTLTIQPQFSNDTTSCSAVSNWFDATEYQIFPIYTTLTTTADVLSNRSTAISYTITGDATAGREFLVQGACMRVKLSVTNSDTYTPIIKARMVNRY